MDEIKIEPLPFGFYAIECCTGRRPFDIYRWDGKVLEFCCADGSWADSLYSSLDTMIDDLLEENMECWYLGE